MYNLSYYSETDTVYKKKSHSMFMLTGAKLCQLEACNYVIVQMYVRPRIKQTISKLQISFKFH